MDLQRKSKASADGVGELRAFPALDRLPELSDCNGEKEHIEKFLNETSS